MFFIVSKLAWLVLAPSNALLLLIGIGLALQLMRWRAVGRLLTSVAGCTLLVIAFGPWGALLSRPLENRFPRPPDGLAAPAGIVVLGGSTDERVSNARDQVTIIAAATRVTTGVELSRRFPSARLVFSGGSAAMIPHSRTEADDTRRIWTALGVAPDRITTEDQSRTTFENALFTRRMLGPKPGERWLLVTSAIHMPRAVGTFRAVGFPVVPYPVDYRTTNTRLDWLPAADATENLHRFDTAAKEWVGLLAYRCTGRVTSMFPAPDP